ncbi:MAG TPA: hypothetical protein VMY79_00040, partial [Dehalococcoidia bacterium]|nr:hypothetical protein [Dehalococcoidia bacterium]
LGFTGYILRLSLANNRFSKIVFAGDPSFSVAPTTATLVGLKNNFILSILLNLSPDISAIQEMAYSIIQALLYPPTLWLTVHCRTQFTYIDKPQIITSNYSIAGESRPNRCVFITTCSVS